MVSRLKFNVMWYSNCRNPRIMYVLYLCYGYVSVHNKEGCKSLVMNHEVMHRLGNSDNKININLC